MFKISRRLDYGLQLMVSLADKEENKAQSTASLSKRLSIPLPFLHQIAHSLMQAGYIKATPGPHGGLRLNQPASNLTMLNIVEALEGPIALNPCQECGSDCERQEECSAQLIWNDLQTKITLHLDSITLEMLIQQANSISMFTLPISNIEPKPVPVIRK
jgi:Rrf2 family protein